MALYRDVQPGDTLRIGEITIEVEQKSGQRTRLRIDGAPEVQHVKAGAKPAMQQPSAAAMPPPRAPEPVQGEPRRPRLQMPQFAPA